MLGDLLPEAGKDLFGVVEFHEPAELPGPGEGEKPELTQSSRGKSVNSDRRGTSQWPAIRIFTSVAKVS